MIVKKYRINLTKKTKEGSMEIKDIQKFIDTDYLAWNKHFVHQERQTEAFVIMMKIAEETGELAREVSRSFGFASKERLEKPSKLDSELADVLINTILLAKCLDIDVPAALTRKMEMIKEKIKNHDNGKCTSGPCQDTGKSC